MPELDFYPRPPQDTGLGIHWSASIYHYTPLADWDRWRDELLAMGIKWVKVLDDSGGSSLELCQRLLDAGIMPIVRLYRPEPNPGHIGGREENTIRKLIEIGVKYIQTNNEPNLPDEWQGRSKPGNYPKKVAENWLIDAQRVLALGGLPITPPWSPGFEPEAFREFLEHLKSIGGETVFKEGACLGSHNYRHRHPTNYPYDEIQQRDNPGCSVLDDNLTFLNWLWVLENFKEVFGFYVPVLCLEGGPVLPFQADDRYPELTPELHAQYVVEEANFMLGRNEIEVNDPKLDIDKLHISREPASWFLCTAWWLIGNSVMGHFNPVWEDQSWYKGDWSHLPCVDALKELPKERVAAPVKPIEEKKPVEKEKPVEAKPVEEKKPVEEEKPAEAPPVEEKKPVEVAPAEPGLEWDERLDQLGVRVEPCPEEQREKGYFKLVKARWYDPQEAQGKHHILVDVRAADGSRLLNQGIRVEWPTDAAVIYISKPPAEEYGADFGLYAAIGEPGKGPYSVSIEGVPSDKVCGLGLGTPEQPDSSVYTCFGLVWQFVGPQEA